MTTENKNSKRLLRRTAAEIKRYRTTVKVLSAMAAVIMVTVAVVYIVSVMYNKYGSFTVMVDKFDGAKYGLTLSETPDFILPTVRLNSKASEEITNISVNDLPQDLDMVNGEHNGNNYVAYTFYMKNAGKEAVDVEYQLYIANMTRDIEKAARVRLYVNGESRDFARTRTDGGGAEPNTVEFYNETTIVKERILGLKSEAASKFTVVIWLEGDDPDCTDELIGGQFKIDMTMSIINVDNENVAD